MKERQKKKGALWGKVPHAWRTLCLLAKYTLEMLAPERESSRAVHSLTAEELSAYAEPAEEIGADRKALFAYRDPLIRRLIWEIKYHVSPKAIALAAEILAADLAEEIAERALFDGLSGVLLVSIPASSSRAAERGGDSLTLIATRTAQILGGVCAHAPRALYKTRDTKPQTTLGNRAERLKNVVGSFAIREGVAVRDRDVIVLDDVTTTGSTFLEARRALRAAGARRVICVALAH